MQSQQIIAVTLLGIFLSLFPSVVSADLPIQDSGLKNKLLEVRHTSKVYSSIGNYVVPVAEVRQGQQIQVSSSDDGAYYELKFGHGLGFVDKNDMGNIDESREEKYDLAAANMPPINQNLITRHPTDIHIDSNHESEVLGVFTENLCYPIIGKRKDKLNTTWYQVNIGERLGFVSELECEIDNGIPIFTYHHLLKNEENKLYRKSSTTTSDLVFREQLSCLKQSGYTTISLYQLEAYIGNRINLPGKAVVLTFDDGLKSVHRYAYPLLKEHGFTATAFIISSRIKRHPQKWNPDSLQLLSISELNEIRDVFDIQSHSHFLHRLAPKRRSILLTRPPRQIQLDLERSRRVLELFNQHVIFFSYPFGAHSRDTIQAAKDARFHLADRKPTSSPSGSKRLRLGPRNRSQRYL